MKLIKGLLLTLTLKLLNWLLKHKGNSLIIGGPMGWNWHSTIDDAHHGIRGSGLHGDSHSRWHDHSLPEDGSPVRLGTQIQDLNMGNYRIINVGAPMSSQDATTKAYVDNVALLAAIILGD